MVPHDISSLSGALLTLEDLLSIADGGEGAGVGGAGAIPGSGTGVDILGAGLGSGVGMGAGSCVTSGEEIGTGAAAGNIGLIGVASEPGVGAVGVEGLGRAG